MTVYAIHDSQGTLVSVGTVIANPLPAGLTAVTLAAGDARGLQDGSRSWNPTTKAVEPTPGYVDPAVTEGNRGTLEQQLDALIATTGTLTGAQLSRAVRGLARIARSKLDSSAT